MDRRQDSKQLLVHPKLRARSHYSEQNSTQSEAQILVFERVFTTGKSLNLMDLSLAWNRDKRTHRWDGKSLQTLAKSFVFKVAAAVESDARLAVPAELRCFRGLILSAGEF